jgi:hypothetical protein
MFELPYPVTAFLSEYRDYVIPLSMMCLARWVGGRSVAASALTFLISAVVVFAAYLALCRILRMDREAESLTYVTDVFGPAFLTAAAAVGVLAFFFRPHDDRARFLAALVASSVLIAVAVPLSQLLGATLRFGYGNVARVFDTPLSDWLRYGAVGFVTALAALTLQPSPDGAWVRSPSTRF